VSLLLLLVAAAWPQAPAETSADAERRRLEEELVKLAQRNTWVGVERTYQRLVALEVALGCQDHYLAAKAALARGDAMRAWYRYRRAVGAPAQTPEDEASREPAAAEMTLLESRYGFVSLYVGRNAIPALYRDAMPFAQEERDAILAAQSQVTASHAFRGLLPVGGYAIDTVRFEVRGGSEWLVVTAGER
jgi:hypothetical protein